MLFVRTLTWVELTESRPRQHSSNASTSGWQFPLLYRWWSARQDRTNLEPPALIAAQALAFQSSLKQLLTTRQAVCSRCGSADTQRINERRTGLCGRACKRWKVRFLLIFEQQGYTDLVQWIKWLRSRRVKEVNDFVRDGGQLEAVKGSRSRYRAESKRPRKPNPDP